MTAASAPKESEASLPGGGFLLLITAASFLLGFACLGLVPMHVAAPVWPVNAFILAGALNRRRLGALVVMGAGFIGLLAAVLVEHGAPLMAVIDILEVGFCLVALHLARPAGADLTRFADLPIFLCLAGLAPALSGVAAAAAAGLNADSGHEFWLQWTSSGALGLLIVTPSVSALIKGPARDEAGWREGRRALLALAIGGLVLFGVRALHNEVADVLALAVLTIACAPAGPRVAALTLLGLAAVSTLRRLSPVYFPVPGLGPPLYPLAMEQAWLATLGLLLLPLSSLIEGHRRLSGELSLRLLQSEADRDALEGSGRLERLAGSMASIGYWRTDLRTNETVWSDEMARMLGFDPTAPRPPGLNVLKVIQTLVVEEDRARLMQLSESMRKDGEPWAFEARLIRANDGSCRTFSVRGEPIRDASGEVVAVLSVARDKTQEAQTLELLERSEALYRMVTEHSQDPVLHFAIDGTIRFASEAVKIYGYTPDQLVGCKAIDLVHPDDKTALAGFLAGLMAGGRPEALAYNDEFRILDASGGYHWVQGNPSLVFDAKGLPDGYVNSVRPIGARKAIEAELKASEARYRTIAERVSDIIAITPVSGRFLYVSPSIEATTGYKPEELVGTLWAQHIHPDDVEAAVAAYLNVMEERAEAAPIIRYRIRRKNGAWMWLEARPSALRDASGRFEAFLDVIRDASLQVALETELTAAKDAAEQVAAVKAEFLANMSHEIRTPLTAVLGFSEQLALQPELSPESREDLARIQHAGKTLLSIVNDILELSRLEAGRVQITRQPTELGGFFTDLVQMFAPMATAKALNLTLESDAPEKLVLDLDADHLRQVTLNLVGNALKFTEHGFVRIRVRHDAAASLLRVEVEDSGPGLDEAQLSNLFERFSQLETGSARRYAGSGLGLAICRGLIEAMDGRIGVDSRPGAGSTFFFEVEARVVQAAPFAPAQQGLDSASQAQGARVLVVDDNALNRELALRVLRSFGFEVDLATGGEEGVEAARLRAYDLIMMDVRMPRLDGPTAAALIRRECILNEKTPIVAFTADVDERLEKNTAHLFEGFVRKPLEVSQLFEVLNAVFDPDRPQMPVADMAD